MQYVTDDIFVNENVKFDSDHLPCLPSENIFLYFCSEGLDLRTIVQLLHVTTMLSVVLTLIGRRACYKWNLLFTLNRNIYIDIDIFVAKVLDTLSKTKYGKKTNILVISHQVLFGRNH